MGWSNISGFPAEAVAAPEQVKAFGAQHQVRELVTEEYSLGDTDPREVARQFGAISSTLGELRPCYTWAIDGGTVVAILMDHLDFALPDPEIVGFTGLVGETAQAGVVTDWTRAVEHYGQLRGLAVQRGEQSLILTGPTLGSARVLLDGRGRAVKVIADAPGHS